MRSPKPVVLATTLGVLLLWSVLLPAAGQGGGMTVNADYELFGANQLTGGGHVTWTLTGDVAQQLRADIVHMFDEYPLIPRGFLFYGAVTSGNHNGVIEEPEGRVYTDHLENVLEGGYPVSTTGGTQVGYFLLDRATLLEKDVAGGFNRSTSGIVGTDANSTADLSISFLFNGMSSTPDVTMPLSTQAYAQALFRVFSLEADQYGSWPLQLAQRVGNRTVGWQSLFYDAAHPAVLWAGNSTECASPATGNCRYDPNASFSAESLMDSSAVLGALGVPLDLRFASSAWITFSYTGNVSDATVLVQAAPDAATLSWTTLTNGSLTSAQHTQRGVWQPVTANLSAYLGQKIRIRLLFTSGTGPTEQGFFLSNFAIHAPSAYNGPILESDAHYLIGTISFSNLQSPSGNPTLIRTPGGEVLFYSDGFSTGSPSPDTVRFEGFDLGENPQVLFAVMVVACYFITRLQDSAWDTYREAHPSVFRPAVHKAKWLHWIGRIAIALLILFYFVPTAFFFIGLRVFFNGPAYFFVALAATLALGFGTRAYYQQQLEVAPPPAGPETQGETEPEAAPETSEEGAAEGEVVAHCTHCLREIHSDEQTYACSCGAVYHMSCASGLMRCANCRKPIGGIGVVGEKRSVSMRCASCGEVQTVPEGADPRTLTCASCGGSLRSLDAGKRYLLLASNPAIAFHWLTDLAKAGKPSLVFTTAAPERLRLEFGLKGAQFVQIGGQAPGAVDARKLDPVGLKAILPLAREGKGGILLYDGLDQMVSGSSMGDVVRFLRKANDMAFVHQVTVIGRVGPGILAEPEVQRLAAEFDETIDLSARL